MKRSPVLVGAMLGVLAGILGFGLCLAFDPFRTSTSPLFLQALGGYACVAGLPVTVGGFLFLWGDEPPAFIEHHQSVPLLLGFVLWGIVGALAGLAWRHVSRYARPQWTRSSPGTGSKK